MHRFTHRLLTGLLGVVALGFFAVGLNACPDNHEIPFVRRAVEIYDPASDTWTLGPELPAKSAGVAARGLGGMIYVAGGWNGRRKHPTTTFLRFDPSTSLWEPLPDLSVKRVFAEMVVIDPQIYVLGGSSPVPMEPMDSVEVFDTTTDTWSPGPAMLNARAGFGATVVAGEIYVFGGDGLQAPLDEVEVLDPANGFWQPQSTMPTAAEYLVAETDGTLVYVIDTRSGTVDVYEPVGDTWTAGPPMPFTGSHPASDVVGMEIFVAVTAGGNPRVFLSLDTVAGTWAVRSPRAVKSEFVGVAASGGVVYVIGGEWFRD